MDARSSPGLDELLRHAGWARSLARSLALDEHDADDAVQEAWVAALRRPPKDDRTVRPWLARVVRNALAKRRRGAARREHRERAVARDEAIVDAGTLAESVELQRDVAQAVLELAEPYRTVVVLFHFEGRSSTEIAESLGVSAVTVRQRLLRAREQLRERLDRRYGDRAAWGSVAGVCEPGAAYVASSEEGGALSTFASPGTTVAASGAVVTTSRGLAAAAVVLLVTGLGWGLRDFLRTDVDPAAIEPGAMLASIEPLHAVPSRGSETREAIQQPEDVSGDASGPGEPHGTPSMAVSSHERGNLVVGVRRVGWTQPAEGAFVTVRRDATGGLPFEVVRRTDGTGMVRFEVLPAGVYEVSTLRGHPGSSPILVSEGGEASIVLEQRGGVLVEGEVVDALGRPVPEAEVHLSERAPHVDRSYVVTHADAAGRFTLSGVQEGHTLFARKPGLVASIPVWVLGRAGDVAPVRLALGEPAGTLHGRVVDEDGRALVEARVRVGAPAVARPYLERSNEGRACAPQVVTTDQGGAFSLDSVPAGLQPVCVRAPGRAPFETTVEVVAGETRELELVPPTAGRLFGVVVDENGAPAVGSVVRVVGQDSFGTCAELTDAKGRYELACLAPGDRRIVARGPGGRAEATFRIETGSALEWSPALAPRPDVRGQLVDEEGWPLEGWSVGLGSGEGIDVRLTGPDGRFAFEDVTEGRWSLVVQPDAGASDRFPWLVLDDVEPAFLERRIVVEDPAPERASVAGRVVGPDGQPIRGLLVELGAADGTWRQVVPDGETGAFAVERVPTGLCRVHVHARDYPRLDAAPVELVAGQREELGTLRLDRPCFVNVRVHGLMDESLTRIELAAFAGEEGRDPDEPHAFVRTAEPEVFRSVPLAPGTYEVRLDGAGVESRVTELEVDDETGALDLTTRVASRRRIVLRIPAGGERADWSWCEVTDVRGEWLWDGGARPKRRGDAWDVELEASVRSGVHRLVAGTSTGLSWSGTVEIPRADVAEPFVVTFEGDK